MNKFKPITSLPTRTKDIRTLKNIPRLSSIRCTVRVNTEQPFEETQSQRMANRRRGIPLKSAFVDHSTPNNQSIPINERRKMKRFHTQNKQSIYQHQINSLNKYIKTIPSQAKESTAPSNLSTSKMINRPNEQRKGFLMRQISFTKFDEQRIASQKKYLTKYKYLSKSLPKMMNTHSELKQATQMHEEKLAQCLRVIDKIYVIAKEMQGLGYNTKTNKYMIEYCMKGKPWLKDVFLHESQQKRDVINPRVRKYYLCSMGEIKVKFALFANKYEFSNLRLIEQEIEALYDYIEHTLAQKKIAQLNNVSNYIQTRMKKEGKYMQRSLRFTHVDHDKTNLTKDIYNLQQKYGLMKQITKISRKRYDQLNRTYDKLQLL